MAEWRKFNPVPLSPRGDPLLAWTGDRLVVFGGTALGGKSGELNSLDDGAIYDPADDRWRAIPAPPFKPALSGPEGVWMGEELLIVGVPCEPQVSDDPSPANCSPGGLAAAMFRPADGTWRSVDMPKVSAGAGAHSIRAFGRSDDGAVFSFDSRYWIRSDKTEAWRLLPKPPIRSRLVCAVTGKLVVVSFVDDVTYEESLTRKEEDDGDIHIEPGELDRPPQKAAMSAAVFDAGTNRWQVTKRSIVGETAPTYADAVCAGDRILVLSANEAQSPADFSQFVPASKTWSAIRPPPATVNVNPQSLWTGKEVLVWGDALMAYNPGKDTWRTPPPVETPTAALWAGDRAVLASFRDGSTADIGYETYQPTGP